MDQAYRAGGIIVVDASTLKTITKLPVAGTPSDITLDPSGTRAYVVSSDTGTVTVLDLVSDTVLATRTGLLTSTAIAAHPAGWRVYLAGMPVTLLDTLDNSTATMLSTAGYWGLALDPPGKRLYLTGTYQLVVLDTATRAIASTITLTCCTTQAMVHPAGTRVYVSNATAGVIHVIDATTGAVVTSIADRFGPEGIAVDSSGGRVYVLNRFGPHVWAIDTSTLAVIATIPIPYDSGNAGRIAIGPAAPGPPAPAPTQLAVEYHHDLWDHYFVTSFPQEVAVLDSGLFGAAWQRTAETFNVWSGPDAETSPACRFFSTSFAPRSTHFYTPFPAECATVKANPAWQYEAIAFHLRQPDAAGSCAAGTIPLYRLYNNGMGGAPNHRYTTSRTTFDRMRAAGWIFEGHGLTGAFACTPQTASPGNAEGLWIGTTNDGGPVYLLVHGDGQAYAFFARDASSQPLDVLRANISGANGQFDATATTTISFHPYGSFPTTFTGAYAVRQSIAGTITSALGRTTFAARYWPEYAIPADPVAIAGDFYADVLTPVGGQSAMFTIGADGAIAGSATGCTYTGSGKPHGATNLFDFVLTFGGSGCLLGADTVAGAAFYDAASRTLYAAIFTADRSSGFQIVGRKR